MKKKIKNILCIIMVFIFPANFALIPATAEENIKVVLDGTELVFDVSPRLVKDRVMVPMRKIFEELGSAVIWDEKNQTVSANKNENNISLQINSYMAIVNGNSVLLDHPAVIVNNRVLVPLRFVAESLDATVEWLENTDTVLINTENTDLSSDVMQVLMKRANVLISFHEKSGRTGFASGVLLNNKGDIATCYHVFANELEFCEVILYDNKSCTDIKVVGYDAAIDIAVINIGAVNFDIAELPFGYDLNINDRVTFIGNSDNTWGTIIEGQLRSKNFTYYSQTYYECSPYVSAGGSGGGVYDDKMRLIGIMAASNPSDNFTLIVPSNIIKDVWAQQLSLTFNEFQALVKESPQIRDFLRVLRFEYTQKYLDANSTFMLDRIQFGPELSNEAELFGIAVIITGDAYNALQKDRNNSLKTIVEKTLIEMLRKTNGQYPGKDIIFRLSLVETYDFKPVQLEAKANINYNSERNNWTVIMPICEIGYEYNKETKVKWY